MSERVGSLVREMERASSDVDEAAANGLHVARDADRAASRQAELVQEIGGALRDVGANVDVLAAGCDRLEQ